MKTIWKTFMISMFLIIICESAIFGQNKYNLSEFGHETVTFIKTPAHWDTRDWVTLGVVGAGTFLVYQFDQRIRDRQQESYKLHPSYQKNILMTIGDQWGGFFVAPILPVLLYTTGSLANSNRTKN